MPIIEPNPIQDADWTPILDPGGGEHSRAILLEWSGQLRSAAVQVYIDGQLAAVIDEPGRRAALIGLDRTTMRVIQLLAVTPDDAWTDFADRLGPRLRTTALVQLHRSPSIPFDARAQLVIDEAIFDERPVWCGTDSRAGFGGAFGVGDFGFDAAVGPGFGQYAFGAGPLGFGDAPLEWIVEERDAGEPAAVRLVDAAGDLIGEAPIAWPVFNEVGPPVVIEVGGAVLMGEDE